MTLLEREGITMKIPCTIDVFEEIEPFSGRNFNSYRVGDNQHVLLEPAMNALSFAALVG